MTERPGVAQANLLTQSYYSLSLFVMGGVDLGDLKFTISDAVVENGEVVKEAAVANVGLFINAVISFIIVAFVMFMIIKGMNKAKKKEEAAPTPPPANEVLLAEIRDLLKK